MEKRTPLRKKAVTVIDNMKKLALRIAHTSKRGGQAVLNGSRRGREAFFFRTMTNGLRVAKWAAGKHAGESITEIDATITLALALVKQVKASADVERARAALQPSGGLMEPGEKLLFTGRPATA